MKIKHFVEEMKILCKQIIVCVCGWGGPYSAEAVGDLGGLPDWGQQEVLVSDSRTVRG